MSRRKKSVDVKQKAGTLAELVKNARLTLRLLRDPLVPLYLKAIPLVALLYLFLPFDFIFDPILGLGQLDDIAVILLGVKLFIDMCPQDIVQRHLDEMASVAGVYRVVEEEPGERSQGHYIEVPYSVGGDEEPEN